MFKLYMYCSNKLYIHAFTIIIVYYYAPCIATTKIISILTITLSFFIYVLIWEALYNFIDFCISIDTPKFNFREGIVGIEL